MYPEYNLNGDVTLQVIFESFVLRHFSISFMVVISPTRLVYHPSIMEYGNYLTNLLSS